MRRLVLLLVVLAVAGAGVWLALHSGGADANTRVTSILPRETLAFAHVPDFERARAQWRETDIYKLWREPAVQEFLQKPLAQAQHSDSVEERLQQLERIGMRDAFVAVTAWQNDAVTVVGGFRFKGSKSDADKIVSQWRARLLPDAQGDTVQHQRHRIEVLRRGKTTIASVCDEEWFFASNNVPALTALLDRANSRTAADATTLGNDSTFAAALKRMPASHAVVAFARPDEIATRLASRLPQNADASGLATLRQMRSFAAATAFEGGKIRDVLFVGVPKSADSAELTRKSLALATNDTFLYLATLLSFPSGDATPNNPPPMPGAGLPAALQGLAGRLGASGVSLAHWNSAFGSELGVIGEWPENARLPALLATLAVKDSARADQIVAAMTDAGGEGSGWSVSDRDGLRYYSQLPGNPLLPIAPTVVIGPERAIVGLDIRSVDAAIRRGLEGEGAALAGTAGFKAAEGSVHGAGQSFTFIDTALLYTRLDAALRPMLIMGAAFVPSIAQAVDLNKVPPAEVITRHLSPVVMSQTYENDGYFTESVGPISMYQAVIGLAGATGAGANWYRANIKGATPVDPALPPADNSEPSPSPDATP